MLKAAMDLTPALTSYQVRGLLLRARQNFVVDNEPSHSLLRSYGFPV